MSSLPKVRMPRRRKPSTMIDPTSDPRLHGGAVEMFMQPIVDLASGRATVLEALARLRRPDGTIVAAAQFVPALGHDELDSLFTIALDQSLGSLAHWIRLGIDVDVSVNLDPSTLSNVQCSVWVNDALVRHGIAPGRLVLELLETRAIDTAEQVVAIDAIGGLGVRIAIDDLGSGHSTVERLEHFDFAVIKIDAGAHSAFPLDPARTLSSLSALIRLSGSLDRPAVVEGLESLDMFAVVALLGAELGQGYAIAHPMPAGEVPAWIAGSGPLIDLDTLTTFSSALAYHWLHSGVDAHPGTVAACPITAFLAADADSALLAHWHAALHDPSDPNSPPSARHLSDWLSAHVVSDGAQVS
jgi:EAL domain-containing protein (putative c-di-GMP-specific phosphodiesterase class I)